MTRSANAKAAHPTRPQAHRRHLVAGVLIAVLIALVGATPAEALTVRVINTDGQGVASRSAPRISATNGYGAPANATVSTVCWTTGDAVGPNANRLWWLISYSGRQFYVADRYLSTPYIAGSTPSEPRCGAAPPPATGNAPAVWVGSPINGTWDLPASRGGDGPTRHHWLSNARDQGDWSVDLIANAGQPVYLYAAPQAAGVDVRAVVDQVGPSCAGGGGGSFATIGLYNGNTRIGSATYAHLKLAVTQGQTLNRWGSLVGHVGSGYAINSNCWTGPHVHFQLYSNRNYACFNKGYSLGSPLSRSNFLGFTGGNVASDYRRACA